MPRFVPCWVLARGPNKDDPGLGRAGPGRARLTPSQGCRAAPPPAIWAAGIHGRKSRSGRGQPKVKNGWSAGQLLFKSVVKILVKSVVKCWSDQWSKCRSNQWSNAGQTSGQNSGQISDQNSGQISGQNTGQISGQTTCQTSWQTTWSNRGGGWGGQMHVLSPDGANQTSRHQLVVKPVTSHQRPVVTDLTYCLGGGGAGARAEPRRGAAALLRLPRPGQRTGAHAARTHARTHAHAHARKNAP